LSCVGFSLISSGAGLGREMGVSHSNYRLRFGCISRSSEEASFCTPRWCGDGLVAAVEDQGSNPSSRWLEGRPVE
jgi:hypothetical protein